MTEIISEMKGLFYSMFQFFKSVFPRKSCRACVRNVSIADDGMHRFRLK